MRAEIKGLENIRKITSRIDMHKVKTPEGAIQELAKFMRERERLYKEKKVWERKVERITSRLKEIHAMEEWLRKFLEDPAVSSQEERDGFFAEEGRGRSVNAPGFTPMVIRY